MAPSEIWNALDISKARGRLLAAGLVEKVGGKKTGRYVLKIKAIA